MRIDPDQEITQPADPETTAEIAKMWWEEIELRSERPTVDMRAVKRPDVQENR